MGRLWLRVDASLARHPKVRRLAEMYGVTPYMVTGFLLSWWGYCAEFGSDGHPADCPRTVLEEIARPMLDASPLADKQPITEALSEARLLDRYGHPWDWQDWTGQLLKRRADDADRKRTVRGQSAASPDPRGRGVEKSRQEQETKNITPRASEALRDLEQDLLGKLPEAYHATLNAFLLAATTPAARLGIVTELIALMSGMHGKYTGDVVGRALLRCASTVNRYDGRFISRSCSRPDEPAEPAAGNGDKPKAKVGWL